MILGNNDSLRDENIPKSDDNRLLLLLGVAVAAVDVAMVGVGLAERALGCDAVVVVDGIASSTSLANNASRGEEELGGEARGGRGEMTLRREDIVVLCGDVYGAVVGGSLAIAETGRRNLAEGARLITAEIGRSFSDIISSRWLESEGNSMVSNNEAKVLLGRTSALVSLTDTAEDGRMILSMRSFPLSLVNGRGESRACAEAGRRSLAEGARLTTADLGRLFSDKRWSWV